MSGMSARLGSTSSDVGPACFFPEFPRPSDRAILSTCTSTSSLGVSYSPRLAMRFSELFHAEDVLVGFAPADKWDAIRRLVDHLATRGRLKPSTAPAIVEAVVLREKSMSTGMEHGIAIPHAAVDAVENVVACMGLVASPEGLAFESVDGRPTRIVVLLVIPRAQKLLHIRTLADIARVLNKDVVRERLLRAQTNAEAWSVLSEGDAPKRS